MVVLTSQRLVFPRGTNIRKMTLTGQCSLTAINGHFYEMDYQSKIYISAGTNRRKMTNLMPPAELTGPFSLVL